MKKILIILFICIPFLKVNAETCYTNYELMEEDSLELYEDYLNNELIKIEKHDGYNNYEVINNVLGYYPSNRPPLNYTSYDQEDYQEVNSYSKTPYSKEDNIYNTNRIKKFEKAKTIQLRSFITSAYLRGLIIRYKGTPIKYSYQQTNYYSNDTLSNNHSIIINLENEYELKDLELEFTFYDNTLSRLAFMLNVYPGSYHLGTSYDYFDNELYRHKYTEKYIVNFLEEDDYLSFLKNISWINSSSYQDTYSVPYYKTSYIKYKYYLTYKNYLNVYTKKPILNYIHDFDDKKEVYDYYIRDYISVDDDISDINNINIESSIPLEYITTEYNDKTNLLTIIYDDYTFYKKIELPPKEEKNISNLTEKESYMTTTKKEPEVTTTRKSAKKTIITTKKMPFPKNKETKLSTTNNQSATFITNKPSSNTCPECKDTSLILKIYKISNSILLIILSIMCKHYVFNRKK